MAENTPSKRLTRGIFSKVEFHGQEPSFDLLITQIYGEIMAALAQASLIGVVKDQSSRTMKRKE
ncbi:hypothetical protein HAX54_019784, partial [Datura stramonium]|nr:hypothetical protein [Datura stramonium]